MVKFLKTKTITSNISILVVITIIRTSIHEHNSSIILLFLLCRPFYIFSLRCCTSAVHTGCHEFINLSTFLFKILDLKDQNILSSLPKKIISTTCINDLNFGTMLGNTEFHFNSKIAGRRCFNFLL